MADPNDQLWGGPLDGRSLKKLGLSEEDAQSGLTYNALSVQDDDSVILHKYDLGTMRYVGEFKTCGIEWERTDEDNVFGHVCVMPTEHSGPCTCLCGEVDDGELP